MEPHEHVETTRAYEPPRVEDIDATLGPAETAPGTTTTTTVASSPHTTTSPIGAEESERWH